MLNVQLETDQYDLSGSVARRKLLHSYKNIAAQLRFAALHPSKPQEEKQFGWWKGDDLGLFCSHKT